MAEEKLSSVRLRAFISITTSTELTIDEWNAYRSQIKHELDKTGIGRGKGLRVDLNVGVTEDTER